MSTKKDHPGVYIPPPLIYVGFFLVALFLQSKFYIDPIVFALSSTKIIGVILLATAVVFFLFRSLRQFLISKNTVITILPANSLQTTGIFSFTRNPMYLGLCLVYLGVSLLIGNWWNIILFPELVILVQEYIIKREEKYLQRRFGQEYLDYQKQVRRWF
ncbi:MAG: isoprenylcysteine carboxylmethyltransferase family protein [Bacteroidetes bacterium]|nr:isoprenylcysteine carboxylmethyltransferase family protein [Bacteroidota bacterium]